MFPRLSFLNIRMTFAQKCVAAQLSTKVIIPLDKLDFQFARSSGPGGQNVNKLNTKAELRFKVTEANWIPFEIRSRLGVQQAHKINGNDELIITCQEHRSQINNRSECIKKLQIMIDAASIEPKEREQWEGPGEKGKQIRRKEKARQSKIKSMRRSTYRDD